MTAIAGERIASAGRGRFVQTGLFIVMEAAWIGALALTLDAAITGAASAFMLIVCALYPLGLVVERLTRRAHLPDRAAWAVHAAALCIAAAVMVPLVLPEGGRLWDAGDRPLAWLVEDARGQRLLALLCLGLFSWIRGAILARGELNAYAVALGFQIGLVVLLAVLAFSSGFDLVWPGASALSLTFVLAGLLALWHMRASTQARRGGSARRSPAVAFLGLAMVLGLGLGLASGLDRGVLEMLLALARRIGETIGAALLFLLSLLPEPDPATLDLPETPGMPVLPSSGEPEPPLRASDLFRLIFGALFFGTFGLAIAMILFANLRALLAWLRRRREHTPGLDYDRSAHRLGDTLRDLWHALREALAAMLRRLRQGMVVRRRHAPPDQPIRRAWLRLERKLGERGWPRRPFETPFDYAARMKSAWPEPGTDLSTLTRAYVGVRYGRPRPVPPARLRKFLKKIGRSLNKVRYREIHADSAGRDTKRD